MCIIEISTKRNQCVIVRTTKSFGGSEYPKAQVQTVETSAKKLYYIEVSYYEIQKSTAADHDVQNIENRQEFACGREIL